MIINFERKQINEYNNIEKKKGKGAWRARARV
jgi:hypothetical protein